MKNLMALQLVILLLIMGCAKEGDDGEEPVPPAPVEHGITYGSETWTALAPTGESIDYSSNYPATRAKKKVGIFYFLWQGAHGYDIPAYHNGDIVAPSAADVKTPYDISEMLKINPDPQALNYGPLGSHHFWGRPYLDYYVGNDEWVIRKHAQMLSDAGVDVIFIDVTNGISYINTVKTLCDVYVKMRKERNPTPQISFMSYTNPQTVVAQLLTLYQGSPSYAPLWFKWEGKPLILSPPGDYAAANSYFTFRYSWFDAKLDEHGGWFGDGLNRWPWGDYYPQNYGHSSTSAKEATSVMAGSHATYNIGRSFAGPSPERLGGRQPSNVTEEMSGKGIYFKQQCKRALEIDPDFVFITAWNEWVAQRQINPPKGSSPRWDSFMGKRIGDNDTYFVDLYNHEFSRDIEPVADGFTDNYYYYMVDFIRKFKGVEAVEPVEQSVKITMDGKFEDWSDVGTRYTDNKGDTQSRNHYGFGYKLGKLISNSGRNDIIVSKVATDGTNIYFYVQTVADLSPFSDKRWMRLLIDVEGSGAKTWEGFQYIVNNQIRDATHTMLQTSQEGWSWGDNVEIEYRVNKSQMEICIPLKKLGIGEANNFTIDFKWIDNNVQNGDIRECMKDGDSAPNSRFRYRYIFKKA